MLARSEGGRSQKETEKPAVTKTSEVPKITEYTGERFMEQVSEQVIQEVLKRGLEEAEASPFPRQSA